MSSSSPRLLLSGRIEKRAHLHSFIPREKKLLVGKKEEEEDEEVVVSGLVSNVISVLVWFLDTAHVHDLKACR